MVRLALALLLCVWVTAAGAQTANVPEYVIQPGDRLQISVLEDPTLNSGVLVRPDGRISLPIVGTISAAGRTPEALGRTVRDRLSRDFVAPPTVTVSLTGLGQQGEEAAVEGLATIYVMGEVARPGTLDVALPIDALQALALAGGPGVFAARTRIQIRRQLQDGGETVFLFDYEAVEDGLTPTDRIPLADGDIIVVPERRLFE